MWGLVELFLAFCIVYTAAVGIPNSRHLQDIAQNGKAVEAEIVSWGVKTRSATSHGWNYVTYYRYQDENGIYYTGVAYQGLRGKEEAESYVGQTTVIYIDGKGESIWSGLLPITLTEEIIIISICSSLFFGIIAFLVVFEIVLKKKYEVKQKEKE